MRLKDKHCIVTGGASGIGEATVRRFVEEGAEVLIADLNVDGAEALASELGSAVTVVKCDIGQEVDVEQVAATPMMDRWTKLMPDQAEAQDMLRGVMSIGRLGDAAEVAAATLFFASDDSTLCQGSILSVDGGFTAQ